MRAHVDEGYFENEDNCCWCGGDGFIENDDPLRYGFDIDVIDCPSCHGSGLAKDQTIW